MHLRSFARKGSIGIVTENRTKEYILVVIINVFFAYYTNLFLGGIPYISLQIVTEKTYWSIIGWFIYGGLFHMVLKWDSIHIKSEYKHIFRSIAVGFLTAFSKAVFDYLTSILIADRLSLITTAVVYGIIYDVFGMGLISLLFIVFVKGKRHWSELSEKPFRWITVDAVVYIMGLIWIFFDSTSILEQIGVSEENILKVDYYYAHVILPLNVWTYTFLMIFFWWLMRTLYNDEGDKQLISEGKENE